MPRVNRCSAYTFGEVFGSAILIHIETVLQSYADLPFDVDPRFVGECVASKNDLCTVVSCMLEMSKRRAHIVAASTEVG